MKRLTQLLIALLLAAGAPIAAEAQIIDRRVLPAELPHARAQATNIISEVESLGTVTPTTATFIIAAQSGTADDLDNVLTTNFVDGATLKVKADAGDTITLKHGTGNITTDTGLDYELTDEAYVELDVTSSGVTLRRGGGGGEPNFLATASSAPTTDKNGGALSGDEIYCDSDDIANGVDCWKRYAADGESWVPLSGWITDRADEVKATASSNGFTISNSGTTITFTGASPLEEHQLVSVDGTGTVSDGRVMRVVSTSGSVSTLAALNGAPVFIDGGPYSGSETASHVRFRTCPWWDSGYGTSAPKFCINDRYSRGKIEMFSDIVKDPGDTPERAWGCMDGTLSTWAVWSAPYPCFYEYSIAYDGSNKFFGSYPHTKRHWQMYAPITATPTSISHPGAFVISVAPNGSITPIDRFWIAPDGGMWAGFRGTLEDNPAFYRSFSVNNASISASDATLTVSSGNPFTANDATNGLKIRVVGAGDDGADLVTTVATYTNANEVELAATAGTTVSGVEAFAGASAYTLASLDDDENHAPSEYHSYYKNQESPAAITIIDPVSDNLHGLAFRKSNAITTGLDFALENSSNEFRLWGVNAGVSGLLGRINYANGVWDIGYYPDGSSSYALRLQAIASSVNRVEIRGAATGNPVQIIADGGDANVNLRLVPRGTGFVETLSSVVIGSPTGGNKGVGSINTDAGLCTDGRCWTSGSEAPATCSIGDLFTDIEGGASTTLYVCTAADTWTPK